MRLCVFSYHRTVAAAVDRFPAAGLDLHGTRDHRVSVLQSTMKLVFAALHIPELERVLGFRNDYDMRTTIANKRQIDINEMFRALSPQKKQ